MDRIARTLALVHALRTPYILRAESNHICLSLLHFVTLASAGPALVPMPLSCW